MVTRSSLCKFLGILYLASLLAGCKLAVISSPFGNITSSNAAHNCSGGKVCEINLTAGFNESFTAAAKPGYQFVKWQAGDGPDSNFQCANSTNPVCTVSLPNNADGAAIAAMPHIGFIMPLFKQL